MKKSNYFEKIRKPVAPPGHAMKTARDYDRKREREEINKELEEAQKEKESNEC